MTNCYLLDIVHSGKLDKQKNSFQTSEILSEEDDADININEESGLYFDQSLINSLCLFALLFLKTLLYLSL